MCFTLYWVASTLVFWVIFVGVVVILRLLIPWVLRLLEIVDSGPILRIFNIIVVIAVAVALIWLCYDLIACAWGRPGYPMFPR